MSKINGTIEHWALSDENINYLILGLDGKQRQDVLSTDELLEPDNEEWLERTLDLDDDEDSIGSLLGDPDATNNLDPDDPRAKLINKLKEKTGYSDARDRIADKYGLNDLKEKVDAYHDKLGAKIGDAIDKVPGAEKLKDIKDPRKVAKDAVEKEALKQADSLMIKFFGTSLTELGEVAAAWLWPAVLAVVVIIALAALGIIMFGLTQLNKPQEAGAAENCGGSSQPIIVIDPGHPSENNVNDSGDPKPASNLAKGININGGTSGNGIDEKDRVLEISKVLKSKLEAKGYKVILTRNSNEFISNKDRAETANNAKAALFLRIHNDGNNNKESEGFFFLYPDKLGSVNGAGVVKGPTAAVRSKSKEATNDLVSAMSKTLPSSGLKVGLGGSGMRGESANGGNASHGGLLLGSVLSDVPVTLLEVGNLKSSKDAKWLKSKSNIELLANSITSGVIKFAPKNTSTASCDVSGKRAKVIATAKAEVGVCGTGLMQNGGEPQKYTDYTCNGGRGGYLPWCAGFVGYVYGKSGVSFPKTCAANQMYDSLVGKHPINSSYVPQPGDAIHKDHHIGLVYKVEGNTLWTIEGNKTACVGIFKYPNYKTSSPWENFGHPKELE